MIANTKPMTARPAAASHTAYLIALNRIRRTPELDRFEEDALLDDWDNIDAHYSWLATAPIEEIVEWAEIAVGG